ncbi:MAG: Na/Pi cotransporter family protein [Clostridia bacterium]|nr:Na/Pi cotransporter family protein [Clostridia bacterium]
MALSLLDAAESVSLNVEDVLTIINNLLLMLGGVAAFIIGMNMMGSGLEKAAGKPIRRLMGKATKNRALGIVTGAAVTAIVTSSSATTVMIVGFVNVGLMTLAQATSLIMGANIGTTITAFITAISTTGGTLEITSIFAFIAFVGALMTMISKNEKVKRVGVILEGLGLIFVGMNTMSTSMASLIKDDTTNVSKAIQSLFVSIGYGKDTLTWEIIVLFLLGALITGLVQSSAAVTAIVISLASADLISFPMAMFIILGTNVGTTVTAMLSSIGTSVNARRTAMVHLMFNIIGSVIFMIVLAFTCKYVSAWLDNGIGIVSWEIAIFHMCFNVLTTLILAPFTKYLVKLACIIVREKKGKGGEETKEPLDPRILKTPAIAVGQTRKEFCHVMDDTYSNYKLALDMLTSRNVSEKDKFLADKQKLEDTCDYLTRFLVKLSLSELSEVDENKVSSFYHVASDLGRIGDYSENIANYAEKMAEGDIDFSEHAWAEVREMDTLISRLYNYAEKAFGGIDVSYLANAEFVEKDIDKMSDQMRESHLRRTSESRCTPEAGAIYLELTINLERIGGHLKNIADSIRMYAGTTSLSTSKATQ